VQLFRQAAIGLLDFVLRRTEPPLFLASSPLHFKPFYVCTGVRWRVVLRSTAGHLAVVPLLLILWTWSLKWDLRRYPLQQNTLSRSQEQFTYYAPDESFPAREGRQREEMPAPAATSRQPVIHVAAEEPRSGIEAPSVTLSGAAHAEMASSNPTLPAVPFSATTRSRLVLPHNSIEVIGPVPDANQLSMRTTAAPAASVVAPPPQIVGVHRRGGLTVPVTVVEDEYGNKNLTVGWNPAKLGSAVQDMVVA